MLFSNTGASLMKRMLLVGVAGLLMLPVMALAQEASKIAIIAPSPVPVRVATADMVVIGKVTSIEGQNVKAPAFPGAKDMAEYQVAVVKIEDAVLGAKGLKEVRVGFIPQTGGVRPVGYRPPMLNEGQEVCLFLSKHHEGDFHIMPAYFSVVDKNAATFEKDVAEAKKAAKLMADPKAGFESKDAEERFLTAAMLVSRYRVRKASATPPKEEAIDAEESKKILLALADADWAMKQPGPLPLSPQYAFGQLNLTDKDGWTPPKNFNDYPEAAKKWLKDNAGTYRIQRFVYEEKKDNKKEEKKKDK
jgi:hypothetical protein